MKLRSFLTLTRRTLLAGAFLALATTAAQATLISATSATTTMGSGFGTSLSNSINGLGLSSLSLTATHVATTPGDSWVSLSTLTGDITFSLGGPVTLGGFSFWNQNAGGPGAAGSTGIQSLLISYSTDNVNFTPLPGAPTTFAQEILGISNAQQFSFSPVTASAVRFTVLSNYGDTAQTGFAEVQFNAVPEPTTALFGLALVGFCTTARRRLAQTMTS